MPESKSFTFVISCNLCIVPKVDTIIFPMLLMRKLRHSKERGLSGPWLVCEGAKTLTQATSLWSPPGLGLHSKDHFCDR